MHKPFVLQKFHKDYHTWIPLKRYATRVQGVRALDKYFISKNPDSESHRLFDVVAQKVVAERLYQNQ